MNYDKFSSILSRIFTFGAFALIALGVIEYLVNLSGHSVPYPWQATKPGHLIELAAALVVFVIALLLRQIRDELRKKA
jgi:hypothetical protein